MFLPLYYLPGMNDDSSVKFVFLNFSCILFLGR